jgi:hypothetical protein
MVVDMVVDMAADTVADTAVVLGHRLEDSIPAVELDLLDTRFHSIQQLAVQDIRPGVRRLAGKL